MRYVPRDWATDLDTGQMELVLSTPQSRCRVLLERYGAVLLTAVAGAARCCSRAGALHFTQY